MALTHLVDTSVLARLRHATVQRQTTRAAHLRRARQVQRLLASRGLRGRKIPDLLIAATG